MPINVKQIRIDAIRRLYILIVSAAMVALNAFFALYVLDFYNREFRTQLYFRGHLFVMALYLGVFLYLGQVFGGILIGVRRIREIVLSFIFTSILGNFFLYIIAMLLSYKFPNPIPAVQVCIVQILFSTLWIYVTGKIYRRCFKPYDVLLIFSGGFLRDFERKLATRNDQFHVISHLKLDPEKEISGGNSKITEDSLNSGGSGIENNDLCLNPEDERVFREIDRYDTVMLYDIPAEIRNRIFKYCYENSKRIYSIPMISDIIMNGSKTLHLFDTPLLLTEGNPLEYEERVFKRAMDIGLSLVLIVLTSPIMLLTAIAIKLYDGGPAIYSQIRCTRNQREFKIMKFRSMIVNAETEGVAKLAEKKDPRITPIGAFIRKCRIDELPQLFNVLKGDMSFVGPRPERPEFIKKYVRDIPEFSYRMKVNAGITGYAQLYGKYNTSPYDKLKLDLYYMEQYSIWLDMKLMILTLKIIFMPESTEGVSTTVSSED